MVKTMTLPGLIDPHVHFRDPGQTHKEDFLTGTSAALAGGFTTVLDMPNNLESVTTLKRLEEKMAIAKTKTACDLGFHFGSLGDNFEEFPKVIDKVYGLKIYLNITTGNFIINKDRLASIYEAWPGTKPILLHAEDDVSDLVLSTLRKIPKPTHICHVSSQAELEFVLRTKEEGLPITCGITPHHLFLNQDDAKRLGPYGQVRPSLKSQKDLDFIWQHLDGVDIIESDHAPHTPAEKESDTPPSGLPGLETTLPLMLTAEAEGKLSHQKLLSLLYDQPSEIFHIVTDDTTAIKVNMDEYELTNEGLQTKCGWTPFAGRRVVGKVERVSLHGVIVYEQGKVLSKPGSGNIITN